MKTVFVTTPQGKKNHGGIEGDTFYRSVKEKDKMRIFDAWSINPKVLNGLEEHGVTKLEYNLDKKVFTISLLDAKLHGFEKTFAGGPTIYIPLKFWKII